MSESILAWQWRHYGAGHRARRNLVLHLVSWPFFVGGLGLVLASPVLGGVLAAIGGALFGLVLMALAMAVQGAGHRREATPPVPFRGPLDVVLRIFSEQLVTFPRFVVSGELARAWRAAA